MKEVLKLGKVIEGKIIERKNRFVVEVLVNGEKFLASNNNTGRLLDYFQKGKKCLCLENSLNLKTKLRLIAGQDKDKFTLIDTQIQMKAFESALKKNLISFLKGAKILKINPRFKNSLFDYLIKKNQKIYFCELKNAVLRKGSLAMYPDCPTLRGRKHIQRIIELKNKGIIIFICALPFVKFFTPYDQGDPEIRQIFKKI